MCSGACKQVFGATFGKEWMFVPMRSIVSVSERNETSKKKK